MPFDWSLVDAVVERIPCGRWASYGDVVRAAGPPSRRFHFGKSQGADDIADVIDWLKEEGVRFDHQGRARLHYRLDVNQLRRLPTNAARAHRLPGRLVDLTDLLGEPHPSHLSG